jgi:hypothetical protein
VVVPAADAGDRDPVCGYLGDDGLTMCWECGRIAPHDMFSPMVTLWKRSRWRRKIKVTHYLCRGGCW